MSRTLRELTTDLLGTVLAFRAAGQEERRPYGVVRQQIEDLVRDFDRRVERERLDPQGDARFALIALIDETVMSSDWDGAAEWTRDPLQVKYYNYFSGAEELFKRLDQLEGRADEDLLEVYFNCLCAGFRGRLRDDPGALTAYRNRLFQRLTVPDLRDEPRLTPDAYGRNLERPLLTRRFPFAWAIPFVLGVVGLYAAYYVILDRQSADIEHLTQSVVSTSPPQ